MKTLICMTKQLQSIWTFWALLFNNVKVLFKENYSGTFLKKVRNFALKLKHPGSGYYREISILHTVSHWMWIKNLDRIHGAAIWGFKSKQQQMDWGRTEFKYHHTSSKFTNFFTAVSPGLNSLHRKQRSEGRDFAIGWRFVPIPHATLILRLKSSPPVGGIWRWSPGDGGGGDQVTRVELSEMGLTPS